MSRPLELSLAMAVLSSIGVLSPKSMARGLTCVASPGRAPLSLAHCTAPTPWFTLMVVKAREYCSRADLTGSATAAGSFPKARESITSVARASVTAIPPRIRRPPTPWQSELSLTVT